MMSLNVLSIIKYFYFVLFVVHFNKSFLRGFIEIIIITIRKEKKKIQKILFIKIKS